ncbi:hypothetical protein H2199_005362 [Coniosporium tulheliwenetii]|uniref:Uncharacterized protein n=1 Tax=Coniosporium tulheliwenetii TaxID=3383036 RepID=A0ACC2Z181_9PEZI|nr:hypothetical protein H2199_005362 [Cladosporium sp. JES 115]
MPDPVVEPDIAEDPNADATLDQAEDCVRTIPNDYRFYRPLNSAHREIRLLIVKPEPADSTAEVVCQIKTVSLDDPEYGGKYECLSYCWGSMTDTLPIKLIYDGLALLDPDGQLHPVWTTYNVTRTLYDALKVYRAQGAAFGIGVRVWADAVCINQSDTVERSQQVGLMRDIYKSAGHTLVWLGDGDEYTDAAMIFALLLSLERNGQDISEWEDGPEKVAGVDRRRIGGIINRSLTLTVEEIGSMGFIIMRKAIQTLFSRPWFRRVWVLQEVFQSLDVAIQCGDKQISWSSILALSIWEERAMEAQGPVLWTEPRIVELMPGVTADMYINEENVNWEMPEIWWILSIWQKRDRVSLSVLLWEMEGFGATDARDRVFALLGIAEETMNTADLPRGFVADYSRSLEQVYTEFTRTIINHYRSLDVLSLINTFRLAKSVGPQRADLPSWVPEYDKPFNNRRAFGYMAKRLYNTSGGRVTPMQDDEASDVLKLRGRIIDHVKTPTKGHDYNNFLTVRTGKDGRAGPELSLGLDVFTNNGLQRLWIEYVASLGTYPTGQDLLEAFIICLLAGRTYYENTLSPEKQEYVSSIDQIPDLLAHFAASWKKKDPDFETLPERCKLYESKQELVSLSEKGNAKEFSSRLLWTCDERCFLVTRGGYIGLCPYGTQAGDVVVSLDGGLVPFIVRMVTGSQDGIEDIHPRYEFVGECYLQGRMHEGGGNGGIEQDFLIQ